MHSDNILIVKAWFHPGRKGSFTQSKKKLSLQIALLYNLTEPIQSAKLQHDSDKKDKNPV